MKRNKEKSISWSDQTIKEKSKERSKGQFRVIREVKIRARTVRDGHELNWAGTRTIIFSD